MKKLVATGLLALLPAAAMAQTAPAGLNTSSLTGAFDATTIVTAILAAGALLVGIRLAMTAVKYVGRITGNT